MQHVEAELRLIETRLRCGPDPMEHGGLYAAQQALRWAAQPEAYASPLTVITRGTREGSGGCPELLRPPAS